MTKKDKDLASFEKSKRNSINNGDEECDNQKRRFCHINRNTLPLKVTLSLFYGGMSAILPYLTIHMRDIGISLTQIATIYAVLPFTAFLGPPILGLMADKMGQYKSVLVVATIITGVCHTCLLLVPRYSESLIYANAEMEFGTGPNGDTVVLRPGSQLLCDSFDKSLRLSGENPLKNQIINIHSCNESNTPKIKQEESLLKTGGFFWGNSPQFRPISDIPMTCHWETSGEPGEDEAINLGYTCNGNLTGSPLESFPFEQEQKRIGKRSADKCLLKVKINSKVEVKGTVPIQRFPPVVCQTNYTFPTGEKITQGSNQLTFWLYFVIRTISNIFMNSCFSLLDATTLAIVGKNPGSDFGKERIMCTLGFAFVSPIAGFLVDQISNAKGYIDYSAAFYLSNVLLFLNVLAYFLLKLDVEKPETSLWKNVVTLLNYPEVVVFLGMIFVLGNMFGFIESYIFIFLDELQAPKYLLGLTITVGNLSSIPVLYGAKWIVQKVGRVNVIVLAFLTYMVRCVGYSYIPNPFWCFPFEAMEGFTYQLMWVAAATYCAVLAPKGLLATLTGVMGSLHYGLGRGSGAFIGGYLITMISTRQSFRYFGLAAGGFGVIYFIINRCWLAPTIKKRNEMEDSVEDGKNKNEQEERMLPPSILKNSTES